MDYGYARISKPTQNIERQIRNILADEPHCKIFKEAFTGTTLQRKELDRLLKQIKPGDTIRFDSVSRMSRDADEGCALYEELYKQGINLIFLKERNINTEVYKKAIEKQIQLEISTGNDATDTFIKSMVTALNDYSIALAKEQIRQAFLQAEKEVTDLHQRTKEGIETARLAGKQIGQKKGAKLNVKKAALAKEKILKINKNFGGTLNNRETWELIGISKMTFYKYQKELLS